MSQYNFIASNIKLDSFSYGVQREGHRLYIDESNHLQIFQDELFEDLTPYTKASYVQGISFGRKYLGNPEKLLDYIKQALDGQDSLEIFSIWLGEKNEVEKRDCHIDQLDRELLKWVFSYGGFKNPRKLKVYKYSRGKK